MKIFLKLAYVEIIIGAILLYHQQYIPLLILVYIFFQTYTLSKRIDYNRKIMRYIILQLNVNFSLIHRNLNIKEEHIKEAAEKAINEEKAHNPEAYKNLEKEINDVLQNKV